MLDMRSKKDLDGQIELPRVYTTYNKEYTIINILGKQSLFNNSLFTSFNSQLYKKSYVRPLLKSSVESYL